MSDVHRIPLISSRVEPPSSSSPSRGGSERSCLKTVCAFIMCALAATPLWAQQSSVRTERVRAAFNIGTQADSAGLSQSLSLVKYAEGSPISADLSAASVPWLDGGATIRVFRNIGAGIAFSGASRTGDASVTASIPHPFFFSQNRSIEGTASLQHRELATHVSAVYLTFIGKMDVAIAGGLSVFNLKQDVVSDVVFGQVYPYDTATFTSAELNRQQSSKTGYHGSADLTWRLAPRWGIGGLLRYSRASVPLNGVTIDAGGLQAGGGVRVM